MKSHRVELTILIVAVIAIAGLALGRQHAQESVRHSIYSTYDTGPNGYRGLYDVLASANVPVSRFSRVLALLDPSVKTLVYSTYAPDIAIAESSGGTAPNPFNAQDTAFLKSFVEAGGRLVVLDNDLAGESDVAPGVGKSQTMTATSAIPLARDAYTAGVTSVAAPIDAALPFDTRNGVPLLADDGGLIAVAYPLGKGVVIAITAPQLFANAHLANAQNARFAYNVIAGHGPVAFDEYVHGYDDDRSFYAALPMPVIVALWLVVAIVLVGLLGANVPFAPPIPLDPPEERDSSAYIDAMAALLRRARAGRAAIDAFAADAARRSPYSDVAQAARARIEQLQATPHPSDAALVEAATLDYRLRKDLT